MKTSEKVESLIRYVFAFHLLCIKVSILFWRLFLFSLQKRQNHCWLFTIPPAGSFLIQESAGWFFVTTHGLTSFFFAGESQRQTRGKQHLARRKLLSLRRNLNGSIRCRRKDQVTPKHIHIQEIRLQRISHPPVGKRKMISIFFFVLWLLHYNLDMLEEF